MNELSSTEKSIVQSMLQDKQEHVQHQPQGPAFSPPTLYSPWISWEKKDYAVDFECRVAIEYTCLAYEPKVMRHNLPEMLLCYLGTLAIEQKQVPVPRRIMAFREGQEYSFVEEKKQPGYFGDLITVLAPGVYRLRHREKDLLVRILSEGYALLKEFILIQFHWFERFDASVCIESLLNDAKAAYPHDHSSPQDNHLLTVFRYSANTMWEQIKRIPSRSLAKIHIPSREKKDILREIEQFLDDQKEFKELELPRKLAYLFSAERGGGKTNLIHAVLGHFNMHKGVLAPEEIDDDLVCVSSLPNRTAIVIENIDEIEDETCLRNLQALLDGREVDRELLIFMTCRSESLNELARKTLLTSQRIDRTIHLRAPAQAQIRNMFDRFFPEAKDKFPSFSKQLGHLPNLSLLENFFRKHLHSSDIADPKTMKELKKMIEEHNKNIESGGRNMVG